MLPPPSDRLIDLLAINRALGGAIDYPALLRLIVEKTAAFLDAGACALLLCGRTGTATVAASVGLPPEKARGFASPLDERVGAELCALFGCPPDRLLAAPLSDAGEIEGVLGACGPAGGDHEADMFMLSALAGQAALALAHAARHCRLEEALATVRESDRRKDEFLAVLSHELRNPLSPVSNSVLVLRRVPAGSDKARRALDVIERQARHLNRLVDDLLDVTRVTRGKLQLRMAKLDLRDLVARTVEDHGTVFANAGVDLEMSLPRAPVPVRGDPARIAQMLGNLLQNAAKFTQRGGRTVVDLGKDAQARMAVLRVTDTGIGIDDEMVGHLFEPFAQADRTLACSRGGLGLGLALVKAFAELQQGTIEASSAGPGLGSTFTLRLPLAVPASTSESAEDPGASERAATKRVLVIEDNKDAAESLREVLELVGRYEVEVASDGCAGLARARCLRPDIVLCDIGLPDMDGYEVARAIRSDPDLAGCMLVAVTGYALPDDIRRAAAAGFDTHLAKPPNIAKIEEIISASS